MTVSQTELARLKWSCRRGMLELDLLLDDFLEKRFASLDRVSQLAFIDLLSCHDQELYHWLVREAIPEDVKHAEILKLIIAHAKSTV